MTMAPEIRARLAQWVDGKISLQKFQEWFVPATWDIHSANDPEAETLTDDIEMALSQYTSGTLPIDELREEMAKTVRPLVPTFHYEVAQVTQGFTLSDLPARIGPKTSLQSGSVVMPGRLCYK